MSEPYVHLNRVGEIPEKSGKICICPILHKSTYGLSVEVIGDPDGLRYLAGVLKWLADFDQNENTDPIGSREHLHLEPNKELDQKSCYVEVCRADAKGTGELADILKET